MKNVVLVPVFLLSFSAFVLNGQNYHRNLFDEYGFSEFIQWSKSHSQTPFLWHGSSYMEAFLIMYETTGDVKYLQTVVSCIGNVIDRRDDLRTTIGLSAISDYEGNINPTWSTNYYNRIRGEGKPYAHLVHSAYITYSMARFASIVSADTRLANVVATGEGRFNGLTFDSIAHELIVVTRETLNFHEDQWVYEKKLGWHYREKCDASVPIDDACKALPMNKHSLVGRTFLQLFLATNDSTLLERVINIVAFLKKNTTIDLTKNSKRWRYWGYVCAPDSLRDDISHAGFTASLPFDCYMYNIQETNGPLYTYEDMIQYANSFTRGIQKDIFELYSGVDYQQQLWDFRTNIKIGTAVNGSYDCSMWLHYSLIDPSIYHSIALLHTSPYYEGVVATKKHPHTLALLTKYEKGLVATIAITERAIYHNQLLTVGNFSGTAEQTEIVSISNFNNVLFSKLQNTGIKKTDSIQLDQSYQVKAIATGRLYDAELDQAIVFGSCHSDPTRNGIFLIEKNVKTDVLNLSLGNFGSGTEFITAADFIPGAFDEVVLAGENTLDIIRVEEETISLLASHILNLPGNTQIKGMRSGNFDADRFAELAILTESKDDCYNGLHLYDVNSAGYLTQSKSLKLRQNEELIGFAILDINFDSIDDFVLLDSTGKFAILEFKTGNFHVVPSEYIRVPERVTGSLVPIRGKAGFLLVGESFRLTIAFNYFHKGNILNSLEASDCGATIIRRDTVTPEQLPIRAKGAKTGGNISIFPNPSSNGSFAVIAGDVGFKRIIYQLFTITGRMIDAGFLDGKYTIIDTPGYQDGLYVLKLIHQDREQTYKVVVTK